MRERVREKPVQRGMGFQPMIHRQDADATKPQYRSHQNSARYVPYRRPTGGSLTRRESLGSAGWLLSLGGWPRTLSLPSQEV